MPRMGEGGKISAQEGLVTYVTRETSREIYRKGMELQASQSTQP